MHKYRAIPKQVDQLRLKYIPLYRDYYSSFYIAIILNTVRFFAVALHLLRITPRFTPPPHLATATRTRLATTTLSPPFVLRFSPLPVPFLLPPFPFAIDNRHQQLLQLWASSFVLLVLACQHTRSEYRSAQSYSTQIESMQYQSDAQVEK